MNARSYRDFSQARAAQSVLSMEEMPRLGYGNIYYLAAIRANSQKAHPRSRVGVLVAAAALAASGVVMVFNFPLGSVIGMPSFFYLLAVSRGD